MTNGLFPPGWGQIYNGAGWLADRLTPASRYLHRIHSVAGAQWLAQRVGRKILPPLDETITYDYSSGVPVSEYNEEVAFYQDNSGTLADC